MTCPKQEQKIAALRLFIAKIYVCMSLSVLCICVHAHVRLCVGVGLGLRQCHHTRPIMRSSGNGGVELQPAWGLVKYGGCVKNNQKKDKKQKQNKKVKKKKTLQIFLCRVRENQPLNQASLSTATFRQLGRSCLMSHSHRQRLIVQNFATTSWMCFIFQNDPNLCIWIQVG